MLPPGKAFAVAPMMDWTDRYCRSFHRLLTRQALLYSEMVTTGAILHGARDRFLAFSPHEDPVALQLGGSDPDDLARACEIAVPYGYREINLNCGCPSDRVQQGRFGACLMAEPLLVRACVAAMKNAVPASVAITVKCRIGIDESDDDDLERFVLTVAEAGVETFIVHARKAWLKGLSPKENREIPPLRYEVVAQLKARHPQLKIHLNGGITDLAQAAEQLAVFDGVMLGRAAYQDPWLLSDVDRRLFGAAQAPSRAEVVAGLVALAEELAVQGQPIRHLTRHTLGLMTGLPGARAWRRRLSEGALDPKAPPSLIAEAAALVSTTEGAQAA